MIQTEEFPVKDLPDRYDIGRTWFYKTYLPELEKAGLGKPLKQGNKSTVTPEQLKFLDALDIAIKEERLSEFLNERAVSGQSSKQSGLLATTTQSDPSAVITILAEAVIQASRQADPVAHIKALEKISECRYLIPTTELRDLLRRKSIAGESIKAYSFVCLRTKLKQGGQSLWQISKVNYDDSELFAHEIDVD